MRDHVDIPRIDSLNKYWSDHPPLQWMIAAYFNIGKKSASGNIEEANEFVPVEKLPQAEFDGLLKDLGMAVIEQPVGAIGENKCQIKT